MGRSKHGGIAFAGLVVIAALGFTGFAGASSSSTQSSPTAGNSGTIVARRPALFSESGLCHIVNLVTNVTSTRSKNVNAIRFSFPRVERGADKALVRAAARALCALPVAPKGTRYCALDLGVRYELRFTSETTGQTGSIISKPVVIDPEGCTFVTGLGTVRSPTTQLWPILGKALGLNGATGRTFTGSLAS